jgi:D-threonate/D-erythronate kinase
MRLGVIADDLTGANDTGVQFARQGARTLVPLDWHDLPALARAADVLVLSTNSRAASPRVAAQRARVAAEALRCAGVDAIYKKIDSTFRGNIGPELDAILDVFPAPLAVLTPAFPPAGRAVREGILLVQGLPVHRTAAGQDPVTPVRESHLPTLVGRQSRRPIYPLGLAALRGRAAALGRTVAGWRAAPGIVVADAVTTADLARLARLITREGLFGVAAGSAGLAGALSAALAWPRKPRPAQGAARGPILLVIGSPNPTTLGQVAWIEERRQATIVRAEVSEVVADSARYRKELQRVAEEAQTAMLAGRHTVLTLLQRTGPGGLRPSASKTLSEFLGHASHLVARRVRPGGIFFCGGDITLAACSGFGAQGLELAGEIEPGVPWGRLVGGEFKGLSTVTKAGGFGKRDALAGVIRFLGRGWRVRRTGIAEKEKA